MVGALSLRDFFGAESKRPLRVDHREGEADKFRKYFDGTLPHHLQGPYSTRDLSWCPACREQVGVERDQAVAECPLCRHRWVLREGQA